MWVLGRRTAGNRALAIESDDDEPAPAPAPEPSPQPDPEAEPEPVPAGKASAGKTAAAKAAAPKVAITSALLARPELSLLPNAAAHGCSWCTRSLCLAVFLGMEISRNHTAMPYIIIWKSSILLIFEAVVLISP